MLCEKSPCLQNVPWNLTCLTVLCVIDTVTVLLGFFGCQNLFACCPLKLVAVSTSGMVVMAVLAPFLHVCFGNLGMSLVPYHLCTIPVLCSHLKTHSGNWVVCQ